jgi:hypothetical protein
MLPVFRKNLTSYLLCRTVLGSEEKIVKYDEVGAQLMEAVRSLMVTKLPRRGAQPHDGNTETSVRIGQVIRLGVVRQTRSLILGDQTSVAMRLCTGLSRAEFVLLPAAGQTRRLGWQNPLTLPVLAPTLNDWRQASVPLRRSTIHGLLSAFV